jgi:hypothetical protein
MWRVTQRQQQGIRHRQEERREARREGGGREIAAANLPSYPLATSLLDSVVTSLA